MDSGSGRGKEGEGCWGAEGRQTLPEEASVSDDAAAAAAAASLVVGCAGKHSGQGVLGECSRAGRAEKIYVTGVRQPKGVVNAPRERRVAEKTQLEYC